MGKGRGHNFLKEENGEGREEGTGKWMESIKCLKLDE